MPSALEFKVLGPIEVARKGESLLLRASLQRRLLAALLSGSGRYVTVDALVEAVWSGTPPDNARRSLMVHMHRLRRSLKDPDRIVHQADGYRIRVDADEFDAQAFDELSTAARKARSEGALEQSVSLFTAATRLWRGAPYEDIPAFGLIAREAQRLEQDRVLVRQELLEVGLDLGRHDSLIGEFEALTRDNPFRERLTALRMLALYRAGRQAEALQVFHGSRTTLREEMGIDPGMLLQRVHEAILRRDERLDLIAAESLDGEWVSHDRSSLKMSATEPPRPRELPAHINEFTGREDALRELEAARLGDPDEDIPPSTVVVVAGMAGVGKTSAAVHWAHRIADDYPDGQLCLNLHGFSAVPALRPVEALSAMLRSLGLSHDQIPTEPDEAAARMRTEMAGRRMLVLLDNAASAEQVIPLLPGGSQTLVIVTSRNQLGELLAQFGGYLLRLESLTAVEAERLLKTLLRMPRSAVRPEIAELARRCGHLPLALRIAAATLIDQPQLDLTEYTRRLVEESQVSTLRIGDSPYTAVRATFDRSYTALPEEVKRTFRLMGIAPVTSLSAEAVSAMADTDLESTERAVENLANAHMANKDSRGRIELHDLMRDYADELLESGNPERAAALERLFGWYVKTADLATGHRYSGHARLVEPDSRAGSIAPADAAQAGQWLDEEGENLISVARYAADHGFGSVAWRLADILRSHAWTEWSGTDCLELGRAALHGALEEGSSSGEAVAALAVATAHHKARDYAEVVSHAARALDHTRRIGWDIGRASAHQLLALACALIGRPRDSVEHAESALAMNRAAGRLRAQSVNLGALAVTRGSLGDLREELRLHSVGLDIAERIGSRDLQASHLRDMASTSVDLGLLGAAEKYLDRIVRIDANSDDGTLKPMTSTVMAALYSALGEHDTAVRYAEAGAREADERGDRTRLAAGLTRCAIALNGLGRHDEAVDAADRALHAAGTDRSEEGLEALAVRAVGHIEIGELEAAKTDAEHLLSLATEGGYRIMEGLALNASAETDLREDNPASASESARKAFDILGPAGHRSGEAWSLWLLGAAARAEGDQTVARRSWRRVVEVYAEIGAPVPTRFTMEAD